MLMFVAVSYIAFVVAVVVALALPAILWASI